MLVRANAQLVASCNFDDSNGTDTGCEYFSVTPTDDDYMVYFASNSATSDTGPTEDHTTSTGMRNDTEMRTTVCGIHIFSKMVK